MNILTANTVTTTEFSSKLEEINVKYKKEKEDLKKIIAETARSQAEQILADDNDDSMGNPEELCKKLAELRLQYNSIIVKQKEEFDSTMKEYTHQIMTNMGKSPEPSVTNTSIRSRSQAETLAYEIINSDQNIKRQVINWLHPRPGRTNNKEMATNLAKQQLSKLYNNYHVARGMEHAPQKVGCCTKDQLLTIMFKLINDKVIN